MIWPLDFGLKSLITRVPSKTKDQKPKTAIERGGLFYTQKGMFDSPDTLDYASACFLSC
jgi:hypothetical protein